MKTESARSRQCYYYCINSVRACPQNENLVEASQPAPSPPPAPSPVPAPAVLPAALAAAQSSEEESDDDEGPSYRPKPFFRKMGLPARVLVDREAAADHRAGLGERHGQRLRQSQIQRQRQRQRQSMARVFQERVKTAKNSPKH